MSIVLKQRFFFTPDDDKTNRRVEFHVDRDYSALRFHCEYAPGKLEDREYARELGRKRYLEYLQPEEERIVRAVKVDRDFVNLFTLSIDCGNTYIGCAHKYKTKQTIHIAAGGSSPGYEPHPACAGRWRVVVNAHMVLSAEVRYSLCVVGVGDGSEDAGAGA